MEFNSRKNSRRDRMMRANSFKTQKVRERDGPEKSRKDERLSRLADGNSGCLPDGRKRM